MSISKEVKNTLIMTAFALAFGLVLGIVHEVTAEPIRIQNEKTLNEAYRSVLPEASSFEDNEEEAEENTELNARVDSVLTGYDADGEEVGYVINITSHGGYGGDITFSMGVNDEGAIEGISITAIDETPGLGMKAKSDPSWLPQFYGQDSDTEFVLGDNIQAITSATFTSRCITRGVNAGMEYYNKNLGGED